MDDSAVDYLALAVAGGAALAITATLVWATRDERWRRGWIAAGVLFVILTALGIADVLRASPRETQFSAVVIGVALPVLGTFGLLRGTRRVRPWIRWPLAFTTAFLLLMGGFLLAAVVSRWLPV